MAEAFIFSTLSARLSGLSMLLIIYNLSSSNFKIANQFSLVLK
jgi:hypothetical protein